MGRGRLQYNLSAAILLQEIQAAHPDSFMQAAAYTVQLPVFEGPLDLLLHLIERAELDITRVALAQVTDQFLAALHTMEERRMDVAASFIVIASRLLQIKSEALLPRPPEREVGEEDPGEMLARQLRLYKQFKDVSLLLHRREADNLRTFLRTAPPPKIPPRLDWSRISLAALKKAAETVLAVRPEPPPLGTMVSPPKVTIRDQIRRIVDNIRSDGRAVFQRLMYGVQSRIEVVVAFLAMLELVKRRHVIARQSDLFGEIEIVPTETFTDQTDFELEFGE
jgi:segregation and condensation protein A